MDVKIPIEQYGPFLKMVEWEMTGSDDIYCKWMYEAKYPGVIPDSQKNLGIGIEIVNSETSVVQEVKKVGFLIDRNSDI